MCDPDKVRSLIAVVGSYLVLGLATGSFGLRPNSALGESERTQWRRDKRQGADELATVGMHGKDEHGRTRPPRQLKYRQIVSHHYDKAEERRQEEIRETENEREI